MHRKNANIFTKFLAIFPNSLFLQSSQAFPVIFWHSESQKMHNGTILRFLFYSN